MRPIFLLILLTWVGTAQAEDAPLDAKTAIDKGLAFLAKDAVTWKSERKCASCHHAPMALWSLSEGKKLGYAVDEKAVFELVAWVVDKEDPAKVFPKQPLKESPPAEINVNQSPLMLALAFEAGDAKDEAARGGLARMLRAVLEGQRPDGSWSVLYVWEPIGSTPDVLTSLALLSLASPNAPDLGQPAKDAQAKGMAWLAAAKTKETPQGAALKLLLWRRLGKPAAEQEPMVKQIIGLQKPDGGWSQTKELSSDAYTTGQALYALAESGLPLNDPIIAKAQAFLLKSQEAGGSWTMTSRPGGPGGKSAKNPAPIAYSGTAWAVMGLMRSTSSAKNADQTGKSAK